MKKKIKKYFKNPMILVFIFILIFFTPQAIYSPGQNRDRGVVVALGIDKNQATYELSLLTFIPTAQQSYKEMTSVISGSGETIAQALYNAQISMGRDIGLSHAKTTVVNEELLQEDVAEYIDYLSRVASLSENTVFICTNSSAKELLEASSTLESTVGLQLEQIIGYNAKHLYVTDTSLEAFYKGYYSREKSSLIGYLSLTDGDQEATETSTSSQSQASPQGDSGGQSNSKEGSSLPQAQGDSSSQGGSGGGQKFIQNKGEAVLLKSGKKAQKLTVDELNGINLLNPKSINQIITIDDVQGDESESKYSYRIKSKRILTIPDYENGQPVYCAQLILGLELVEINGPHEHLKINTEFSKISPEIKRKLDDALKTQFTNALKILRENKTDVIGINESFFKAGRKKYLDYVKRIGGNENFIDHVCFKINFIIQSD